MAIKQLNNKTMKTNKIVSRILTLVQGIITATMAIIVIYGIITNQF